MRAVWMERYGPPEVLVVKTSDDPQPGPGEVVVDVEVAGVNFGETQLRSGARKLGKAVPPLVLGNEVGGRVRSTGPGIDSKLVGKRFVARMGGFGGYADCVRLPADALIAVPDNLEIASAVALIAQGRTALQVAREAAIAAGERVLVEAAAGGTGSLLVQLALRAGAGLVIGAAGGERKLDAVRTLGVHVAVDYTRPDWGKEVLEATGGAGVDVVFESVGGAIGRTAFDVLAPGRGRCLVFGFSSGEPTTLSMHEILMRSVSIRGIGAARAPSASGLNALVAEALSLAAAGSLKPIISATYALEGAAAAHTALEARDTIGKVLLHT